MQQAEIYEFLERYFTANHCEIIERNREYMTVQLTVELDKELMNRPFYWHYLEKTGGEPNPMKLTLIIEQNQNTEKIKGERIHFGSPRLHQIFQSTNKFGKFIRLFENRTVNHNRNIPLHPWLGINVKISYQCDRKRDELVSLGIHLINGMIVPNFHNYLEQLSLTPKIPDYCFTISPLIKPKSGIMRLKQYLESYVQKDNHIWASEARMRWKEDLDLLEHFYAEMDEKPECYEVEKQALKEQYEPKIVIKMINGGIFYLSELAITT